VVATPVSTAHCCNTLATNSFPKVSLGAPPLACRHSCELCFSRPRRAPQKRDKTSDYTFLSGRTRRSVTLENVILEIGARYARFFVDVLACYKNQHKSQVPLRSHLALVLQLLPLRICCCAIIAAALSGDSTRDDGMITRQDDTCTFIVIVLYHWNASSCVAPSSIRRSGKRTWRTRTRSSSGPSSKASLGASSMLCWLLPGIDSERISSELRIASARRNVDIVKVLLIVGAKTERQDTQGSTAQLHRACYRACADGGQLEVAKVLIQKGARPGGASLPTIMMLVELGGVCTLTARDAIVLCLCTHCVNRGTRH